MLDSIIGIILYTLFLGPIALLLLVWAVKSISGLFFIIYTVVLPILWAWDLVTKGWKTANSNISRRSVRIENWGKTDEQIAKRAEKKY